MKAIAQDIANSARQILGGTLSANQYKDYVLALFFLKSATEYYKLGGYLQSDENKPIHWLSVPERSSFDYLLRELDSLELGKLINFALLELEEANCFGSKEIEIGKAINFESNVLGEKNERLSKLRELLRFFESLTFKDSTGEMMDVGCLFNQLLQVFAEEAGKKIDNVFTPKEVVRLMSKLTDDDKENVRLCDPTSSSGALLVEAGKKLKCAGDNIYGQEVNGNLYALAKMNLMLNEFKNFKFLWGDSLGNPKLLDGKRLKLFDIVVSAPPFADKWGSEEANNDPYNRFVYGIPSKNLSAWAYISHILASLDENGQAIVAVPVGVLFRGSEGKIRKEIVESNLLEAVIVFPRNLFYGTDIGTAVLVFRRDRKSKEILFVDVRNQIVPGKGINKLSETNVDQIVELYKSFPNQLQKDKMDGSFMYVATQDEIRHNEYDLQIGKYVREEVAKTEVDVERTVRLIQQAEEELRKNNGQFESVVREIIEIMNKK